MSPVQGLEQHIYTPQERHNFAYQPGALLQYRKEIETGLNSQFSIFLKESKTQKDTREYMIQQMKEKINNVTLAERLIPDWAVGCKQLLSQSYF